MYAGTRVGEYQPGDRVTLVPRPAEYERVKVVEHRSKDGGGRETVVDREDGRGRFAVPSTTPAIPTVDPVPPRVSR